MARWGCWTETAAVPGRRATRPGLDLAARLGRIAAACLIVGNFLYLFAPLSYVTEIERFVDTQQASGEFVDQVSDPGMLASIADLVIGIGLALFAFALAFLLLALRRARRPPARDAFPLGVAALVCLAGVPLVTAWTQARSGGLGSVDAVTALGGWSVGSALLLAGALLYLFFTLRAEQALRPTKLRCLIWPVYAAVNVLGAATFASLLESSAGGGARTDAFIAGIALKIILIPVLGVLAYREVLVRFPDWTMADRVPRPPRARAPTIARPAPAQCAVPSLSLRLPAPPPPEDEVEVPPLGD